MHAQIFNDRSLLCVQKFSIDFKGRNRVNLPNYTVSHAAWTIFEIDLKVGAFPTLSTDLFSSHLYQFMLTTVKKPFEKLYLL